MNVPLGTKLLIGAIAVAIAGCGTTAVTDGDGGGNREDQGQEGRWRCFTREMVKARNDPMSS